MRGLITMLVSLLAAGSMALGAFAATPTAPAPEAEALRTMQPDECMVLEGRDIFTYTSGELYALWKTSDIPVGASIGYMGYEGAEPEAPGLYIPFTGFEVMTRPAGGDASALEEALVSMPLEDTSYAVAYVCITDTGVPGPFGVEVGMTVDTLLGLLPGMTPADLDVEAEGFDTLYTTQYQDGSGFTYTFRAYTLMDMVSYCVIVRDGESRR